jgi:hypothetical protein
MPRALLLLVVVFLMTFGPPSAAAQAKVVSGLAVGAITPSFPVLDVTGPHKGKSVCYVCESQDAPVVFAFFRQTGNETASLIKKLNELASQNQDIKVVAVVIEGQESQPWLERLAEENAITIPLTVLRNGKDDVAVKVYKLNLSARNTILVSAKRKVVANLVNVNAENFKLVTNGVSKVIRKK